MPNRPRAKVVERFPGGGQTDHDATVKVTRVVDGDTIDISPSVEGRSRVRLIGMDTPEVHFGTQPYGPEASAFAKRELDGEEVRLELDVQKIDPYGRLLAYVYLPDGEMFNETLLEEGYAQVATFPPNVKYVDRFLEAQREAREANRGLWGLSAGELCQQTDRDNGIGGGCSGSEPESPAASQIGQSWEWGRQQPGLRKLRIPTKRHREFGARS